VLRVMALSTKAACSGTAPGGGGGYTAAQTKFFGFKPISAKGSVFITAGGGTAFRANGLELKGFTLGGPFRLGAYGQHQLIGNQYFLFRPDILVCYSA
jgi:NTE family protein